MTPFIQSLQGDVMAKLDSITVDELCQRARAAGVDARLDVWKEMWHVFQAFAIVLPEAKHAVATIGGFVREKLGESRQRG